jgi:glutamyl-tRNA synthetase
MLGAPPIVASMPLDWSFPRVSATPPDGKIVTRFAPSPTGYLHIGGARTALFNYLYARHHGGQFHLRIEDTDRARSTQGAIDAILEGMRWLGLDWDGPEVYQFARAGRHAEVANDLLARGHAYRCYATPEELEAMRAEQRANKLPLRYDGRWRDRTDWPNDAPYVIRLKAPRDGEVTIHDRVQGPVTVQNVELDDFVLLRSDSTPTYMLSVVVDDHEMGVTHVIRGDDHLNNAFRQLVIIRAMDWPEPVYAHVPLIHGSDGAKLSKRHGALGVEAYREEMGVLPEALANYLLRLGWGHGDDEIISREQAIEWFDIDAVGRSPSRFDVKKLENINGHYLREADDMRLSRLVAAVIAPQRKDFHFPFERQQEYQDQSIELMAHLLVPAMPSLKVRAKSVLDLADSAQFLFAERPIPLVEAAKALLTSDALALLGKMRAVLVNLHDWSTEMLESALKTFAEEQGLGLGKIAQPLRAALTGRTTSPGIFDVLVLLGRDEALGRLDDCIGAGAGL